MRSVLGVRTRAAAALWLGLCLLAAAPAAGGGLGLAPTRSGPGLAEVGAGLDFWLAESLAAAGLATSPIEASEAGAGLSGAEGLSGALLPRLFERGDATRLELAWVDPANGALLGSAAAEAPLAEIGRAATAALAELAPSLGAPDPGLAPPDLAALAATGRARAHAGAGELHAAWLALEGQRLPPADALRADLLLRARRSGDAPPERARLLAASGDPEGAWAVLGSRANLEVNKPRPDPALLLAAGEVQLARRNPRSAMRYLEAAERVAADWIDVHVAVARARLLQKDGEAAREAAQRAAALDPEDPRPLELLAEVDSVPGPDAAHELALGDLRARDLDPDRARPHWQRAVELDPDRRSEAALATARLEARLGRPEQSREAWQRAADAGVDTPELWTGLGAAHASLGRSEEAERSLRRAVSLDADHGPALERLGALLTDTERPAEAVPVLQRARRLQPESIARRVALAKALRMSGQSHDAVEVLVSGGMPQDAQALRELAASQRAAGDASAASRTLARAVELRPYDPSLREHYAVALEASGDVDAAERQRTLGSQAIGDSAETSGSAPGATAHGEAVDFDALVASFTAELADPATTRVAMFEVREPSDAKTWLRRLTRLREPDTGRVEAVLRAAVGASFRLVELHEDAHDALRETVDPLFDFDSPGSRSAEDIARVNTVLGTDGIFVTRLISHPGDRSGIDCAPGTFALETRLLTGGDAAYVNLLGASDCVAGGLEAYGRWNVTAFALLAAILVFLVHPVVRGWGTLVVRIQLPDKTNGFFNIFITTSPNQVRKEVVDKKTGREKLVARRSFDPLRRFRKHMAGSEETFRLIPARRSDYTVTVGGPLLDSHGEKIIGFFLEERPARVRRRGVTELDFDFRPRECAVEVKVAWQGQPAEGAQVAVAGDPSSLRYARDGQAFLYLGKGEYGIRVGNKKAAAEFRVLIESYENAVPLAVDLADCDALFRDCPEAVEPFLLGDYASAIDALESRGDEEAARRLRAELLEQRGQAGDAARELEAAGRLEEAAQLRATSADHAGSAELYEQAGDDARAAAAYRAAGRFGEAARCYERLYDYGNALECWREVGDSARELDLLEKLGEYFEAAELARAQGERERAIHDLQQIDQRHPQYRHACRQIAEIVAEQGDCELAIAKYEESFAELGTEGAALDALESYAQVLERASRHEQALSVWEVIRRRDVERSDVGTRIQALRSQLEAATQAAHRGAAPAPAAAPAESRYELLEEIGRGGMGVVYKARDRRLGRIVALKRLPENLRQHPSAVQLFEREARAAAALNHANIVTLFDAGEEDGTYFITMELLEGRALNDIVARHGRLSARDTARIGIQVAAGLHYAHVQRIVHRDIKTANLFFTKDQVVKIMDFGIAKSLEEVRRSTTVVGGTPYYMAPEQATGQGVDHRADLYAFGVTLFQLCTGALPFSEGDVNYHHAHTPPPDPREVCMDVPDPLATLILRMLAKRPDERPAHAAEVAETLRAFLG